MNDESPDTGCHVVLDEITALRSEIEGMEDGQVIVVFYDTLEPVTSPLESVGARPVSAIGGMKPAGAGRGVNAYSAIGA